MRAANKIIKHVQSLIHRSLLPSVPRGLENVSKYPALFTEMARRGWSQADLKKLAGENLLRVFRKVEQVSSV